MLIRLLEDIGVLWFGGFAVCVQTLNSARSHDLQLLVGLEFIGEISQFRSSGAYFWVFSAVLVSSLSGYIFSFILWPHFVASFCGL